MRLLFLGEVADLDRLRSHLDEFAGADWSARQDIALITVNDRRNEKDVRAQLKKALRPAGDYRVCLLRHDTEYSDKGLPQALSLHRASAKHNLEAFLKEELRPILRYVGADWRERVEQHLRAWEYPDPAEEHVQDWPTQSIDRWLSQFDRLTDAGGRLIGATLLQCFEMVSRAQLIERFRPQADAQALCVMRYDNGKSADALTGLLKKGVLANNGTVHNFNDMARQIPLPEGKIVVFEDGLFSGTEWVGIFHSLLGLEEENPKCERLPDPAVLKQMDLRLYFAVATTVGTALLRRELDRLGLQNVQIEAANVVEVLSDAGRERLAANTLFADDGKIARDSVVPHIFEHLRWAGKAADAVQMCERIGRDLWSDYRKRKLKPITEDFLERVALGASNLGFALAFPFSMPKVTLPMFWCTGPVQGHARRFDWKPLFPNAA